MKKIVVFLIVSVMALALAACGGTGTANNGGSGNNTGSSSSEKSGLAGYYEITYKEGSAIPEADIEFLKSAGRVVSLTINEDGTASLDRMGSVTDMNYDSAKSVFTYDGGEMTVTNEDGVLKVDEQGQILFFAPAEKNSAASPADEPVGPVSGSELLGRQILGVDDDLSTYRPTGITDILLTSEGRLTLMTYGDLAEAEGSEATLATDASSVDIYDLGNDGYRVILFTRNDGTVSAVDPTALIEEHRISVIDNLGGLTHINSISTQQDGEETVIVATDRDGNTTILNQYLN